MTLSRNADATAVMTLRTTRMRYGSPPARRAARTAIQPKTPVFRMMPAKIIMPASRKMTLKSISSKARSWLTTPSRIMATPPAMAAIVLWSRSVAMAA